MKRTIHSQSPFGSKMTFCLRKLANCALMVGATFIALASTHGYGADVEASLSAREAYVGTPVALEVSIVDAEDFDEPELPAIDGCDVRSAGAPSQRSSISIINGRRSESRSVAFRYLIIPRRVGTFDVPPLNLKVDGKSLRTRPLQFVATRSENGDALFVEIEGKKNKVFVGQPLDLKLKLWIKPYRDREHNLKLSEGDMWQLISEQTEWGMFADRMQELADNNQRPGGEEVLRDDGQGGQRSYYLYEIDATIYPTKPGSIAGDDVQVVVNYPTEISKARDPFDSFFGGDPFDRESIFSQMMDDDFFASPFRNRLQVSRYRPIVASAQVDTTQIVPVPTVGRPADYRGAVGKYRIVTQATPTSVNAGDPITLNIGIAGTGPMELVQAPPLAELKDLTADFKVADRSLAGFVEDETKLFSTTIRPLREGITQIPSIPFSYFDPETEKFFTVRSEPITITVDKSESLALDAIVANSQTDRTNESDSAVSLFTPKKPDFTNRVGAELLISRTGNSVWRWWMVFVSVPPLVWLGLMIVRCSHAMIVRFPGIRSAYTTCLNRVSRATDHETLVDAITRYIERRVHRVCDEPVHAVGALRSLGAYTIAGETEAFFQRCENVRFSGDVDSLDACKTAARELLVDLEATLKSIRKSRVRRKEKSRKSSRGKKAVAGAAILLIFGFAGGSTAMADDTSDAVTAHRHVELTPAQRETILREATKLYQQAVSKSEQTPNHAKETFAKAAQKYQLLVDSGIRNSGLYFNLGNAYLQGGKLGYAIANYERARLLDPADRQVAANLQAASEQAGVVASASASPDGSISLSAIGKRLARANEVVIQFIGLTPVIWMLVISSLAFWGILIARSLGARFRYWRWAIPCFLLLSLSAASYGQALLTVINHQVLAVIVADRIALHSGDGEQFPVTEEINDAVGRRVQVTTRRGDWARIKTQAGVHGWIPASNIEPIVHGDVLSSDKP